MDKLSLGDLLASSRASGQKAEQLGRRLENDKKDLANSTNEIDPKKEKEIKGAATQFEGLLIQEMLKSMWGTVPKGELLSGSDEEQTYRDMLNEAVGKSVSQGKGMGIRDVIMRDMEHIEKREK